MGSVWALQFYLIIVHNLTVTANLLQYIQYNIFFLLYILVSEFEGKVHMSHNNFLHIELVNHHSGS